MKPIYAYVVFAALLALGVQACSQLDLATPKSFEQRAAYSEGIVTAIRNSTTAALTAGTIKVTDAQQVEVLAEQADALIVASRLASSTGDTSTALAKLALATNILTQLQTYVSHTGSAK